MKRQLGSVGITKSPADFFMQLLCPPGSFFSAQGDVDLFEFEAVLNCVTTGRSGVGTNRIPQLASGGSDSEEAEAQEAEAGDFRATFCWHSFLLKKIVLHGRELYHVIIYDNVCVVLAEARK